MHHVEPTAYKVGLISAKRVLRELFIDFHLSRENVVDRSLSLLYNAHARAFALTEINGERVIGLGVFPL